MNEIIYPYLPPGRIIRFVSEDNSFMTEAKKVSEEMGCLKQPTGAVIVKNGMIIGRGSNSGKKVDYCPRIQKGSKTGEDYYLCKKFCLQNGHAEVMAIKDAQSKRKNTGGGDLYLYGHWWCCKDCWDKMIEAEIKNVYLVEDADKKFKR